MPTLVACPRCKRKLRVPDDLVGKNVKCPGCQELFTANAGGDTTLALPPEKAGEERVSDRPLPRPVGDEDERVTTRPRQSEDEEDEADYEDDEPKRAIPRANWWRVRSGFSLLLASALTYVGAMLMYIGGVMCLGVAVGVAAAKAGGGGGGPNPQMGAAGMMTGIIVMVVLLMSALLIGYILGFIGHFLALASPRTHGAKTLAVAILVFTLVGLALTILPYALSAATGGISGMMMGGFGNPMFGGAGMGDLPNTPQWVTIVNLILGLINNLLTVVALFTFGFYVRAIALCLGDSSLARSAKGWMIMLGVVTVLGLVVTLAFLVVFKDLMLNPGAAPPGAVPGGSPSTLVAFGGGACLFGIVALALLIWYIIMLAQARNAISSRAAPR